MLLHFLSPSRSAFLFFSQEKRPVLKAKHPSATVAEIAKQLGAAWRMMKPEQKQPYMDKSNGDREKYAKEMEDFRKGFSAIQDEEEEGDGEE